MKQIDTQIQFRPYREADKASLIADCYHHKPPRFIQNKIRNEAHLPAPSTRSIHLIGIYAGRVVASGFVHHTPLYVELTDLYVTPSRRGEGIGTRLIQKLIQLSQQWGCQPIELTVKVENRQAQVLYKRMGFIEKSTFEYRNEKIIIMRMTKSAEHEKHLSEMGTNRNHLVNQSYSSSDKLEVRIRTHQLYSEFKGDFFAWVLDHHHWTNDELVLDVGCGSGRYIPAIGERARSYYAGDLSYGMLNDLPLGIDRVNLDVQQLPYADRSADVILANHMLYHVPDREKGIREFRRVLKPGGTLLAATNSAENRKELVALRRAGFEAIGFEFTLGDSSVSEKRFSTESGGELLSTGFETVELRYLRDALLFPNPQPILDYINSSRDWWEPLFPSGITWVDYENALRSILAEHFKKESIFRVSKLTGVFVCS